MALATLLPALVLAALLATAVLATLAAGILLLLAGFLLTALLLARLLLAAALLRPAWVLIHVGHGKLLLSRDNPAMEQPVAKAMVPVPRAMHGCAKTLSFNE